MFDESLTHIQWRLTVEKEARPLENLKVEQRQVIETKAKIEQQHQLLIATLQGWQQKEIALQQAQPEAIAAQEVISCRTA